MWTLYYMTGTIQQSIPEDPNQHQGRHRGICICHRTITPHHCIVASRGLMLFPLPIPERQIPPFTPRRIPVHQIDAAHFLIGFPPLCPPALITLGPGLEGRPIGLLDAQVSHFFYYTASWNSVTVISIQQAISTEVIATPV